MIDAKTVIWLHDDALNPSHPVIASNPDADIVCIFDTTYLKRLQYSFKRCVFIYECMVSCPGNTYCGDTYDVLTALIEQHNWHKLITLPTHTPYYKTILSKINQEIDVVVDESCLFCGGLDTPVTQRFMKYWWRVRKQVLKSI